MKIFRLRYNDQGSTVPQAAVVVADDPAKASTMLADCFGPIELCCVERIGDALPPARIVLDGVDDVSG